MDEYKGVDYLRNKLAKKSTRVIMRYRVYDMKEIDSTPSIVTPQWLKGLYRSALGWCTKSVNALADRLVFKGFADGDDVYGTNSIFEMNNPDIFFDSVIRESLIAACAFVHISHGDGDEKIPKLSVLTADNATGIIDEFTGLLKEGYAVLARDEFGTPTTEAYFTKEYTEYYKDGKVIRENNPAQYPLLVPVPFEPTSKRPFGHSRISRDCMDLQKEAQRALERADISAEFYSFPQKWVTGLDPDADPMDSWKASASSFLRFDKDENGDSPKLGQFSQQSMAPYIEQVRMFASLFSGATGLTLDDLGFVTDNPSSAEAIKAAHENLRQTARRAQRTYASAFANVGYIAASVRDENPYPRSLVASMRAEWEPIFEPDAAMITSIGDGAIKINQAVPGFFNVDNLEAMTGIESNAEPVSVEEAPESRSMSAAINASEAILREVRKDARLAKLVAEAMENGSYGTAEEYAIRLGEIVVKVLDKISPDEIPKETLQEAMRLSNDLVADVTTHVQETLNDASGIGLGVQIPDITDMTFSGFTDYSAEGQQKASEDAITDFLIQQVDKAMQKNAQQNARLGIDAKIVRKAERPAYPSGKKRVRSKKGKIYEYAWSRYGDMYLEPCPFCLEREGTYNYEDVLATGSECYRRHKRCRCEITYVQGKLRQDVLTRSTWTEDEADGRRKAVNATLDRKQQEEQRRLYNRETKIDVMNRLQKDLGWSAKGASIFYEKNKTKAEYQSWDYLIELAEQNQQRRRDAALMR